MWNYMLADPEDPETRKPEDPEEKAECPVIRIQQRREEKEDTTTMKRRAWFVVASIVAASTVKNSIALSASSRMDHDGRIRSRAHPNSLGLAYVTRPETRLLTIQDNRKRKSRLSSSSSAAHQTVSETEIVVEASPPQQTEEHTNTEEVLQVGLREEEEAVPSEWSHALRRFYLGEIGPPLVVLSICAFAYARFKLSCVFAVTDTLVFASSVIFWWIQEYFFHRVLLHAPFGWIGNSIHQKHHDKTYFHVSVDPPALLLGWLFAAHFMLKSVLPWNLCLSATIGYASAGLFYEWSHYM